MSSIFHALLYISQPMATNHHQYLVQGGQVHSTSLAIEDPLALASHVVLISCVSDDRASSSCLPESPHGTESPADQDFPI